MEPLSRLRYIKYTYTHTHTKAAPEQSLRDSILGEDGADRLGEGCADQSSPLGTPSVIQLFVLSPES